MSGHGQEQASPLKRDCLKETAGSHHTCIAVFLGVTTLPKTARASQVFSMTASFVATPETNEMFGMQANHSFPPRPSVENRHEAHVCAHQYARIVLLIMVSP